MKMNEKYNLYFYIPMVDKNTRKAIKSFSLVKSITNYIYYNPVFDYNSYQCKISMVGIRNNYEDIGKLIKQVINIHKKIENYIWCTDDHDSLEFDIYVDAGKITYAKKTYSHIIEVSVNKDEVVAELYNVEDYVDETDFQRNALFHYEYKLKE